MSPPTSSPSPVHKLAAIMFTDIVGYTALMGKDQRKAMSLVDQSQQIQKPIVEKHGGTWHKDLGDGSLISFPSALEAVECAVGIQKSIRDHPELTLRIGIHLGDVTFRENDVYGDGVNISSRIESITDPGGIYISESVSKAIKGRSVIGMDYLGEFYLKNVDEPVKIFALQGDNLPIPSKKLKSVDPMSFRSRLQRRNIPRVGLTYAISALIIYQLAVSYLPVLDPVLVIGVLSLGFAIAIVLAWNFEFSPTGIVRTQSKAASINPYKPTQRKPLTGNLVIGVLALVFLATYFLPFGPNKTKSSDIASDQQSIAVLPFENMSNDPNQDYFSDGLSEELINAFVKVPGLKVAGRTSAFSYKGKNVNLTTIGEELGVATILEGSVRKDRDRVRVTAQLIDAENGFHLWSEVYDRQLSDIFAIQDEITGSIVRSLSGILVEGQEIVKTSETNDIEAYTLYLQARQKLATRQVSDLYESKRLFEETIQIDPNYSKAYSGLARSSSLILGYQYSPSKTAYDFAVEAANQALELDPNNAEAYSVLSYIALDFSWDLDLAREACLKSLDLGAADAEILNFVGDYYRITFNIPKALEYEGKALQLDPLHAVNHWELAFAYMLAEDWENALKYATSGYNLGATDYTDNTLTLYTIYENSGLGKRQIEQYYEDYGPFFDFPGNDDHFKAIISLANNKMEEAKKYADNLEGPGRDGTYPPSYLFWLNLKLDRVEKSLHWLDRTIEDRDGNLIWDYLMSVPEELPGDPRFKVLLDHPQLNALWNIRRSNMN